jgi:hypothetical protein
MSHGQLYKYVEHWQDDTMILPESTGWYVFQSWADGTWTRIAGPFETYEEASNALDRLEADSKP